MQLVFITMCSRRSSWPRSSSRRASRPLPARTPSLWRRVAISCRWNASRFASRSRHSATSVDRALRPRGRGRMSRSRRARISRRGRSRRADAARGSAQFGACGARRRRGARRRCADEFERSAARVSGAIARDERQHSGQRDQCAALGFDLFEGYRFTGPEVLSRPEVGVDICTRFACSSCYEIRRPRIARSRR